MPARQYYYQSAPSRSGRTESIHSNGLIDSYRHFPPHQPALLFFEQFYHSSRLSVSPLAGRRMFDETLSVGKQSYLLFWLHWHIPAQSHRVLADILLNATLLNLQTFADHAPDITR